MPFSNMGGWSFIIIVLVILLLFGAPKLPALSKSIADSIKIIRKEIVSDKDKSDPEDKTPDSDSSPK